jgi:uncharacterized membrane protein YccC
MAAWRGPDAVHVRIAVAQSAVLTVASLCSWALTRALVGWIHPAPRNDELLGAMWAVLATIFVCRDSFQRSVTAAVSRMWATLASFVLCLIYLIFLPFRLWALAVLIGLGALVVTLLGRPEDATTAAITTAVVLVVAAITPAEAWQQPILRFADTAIGVCVGVAAAWLSLRLVHPRLGDPAHVRSSS